VRVCPVKAIRVADGHSEVIQEKCIACGLCVNECGQRGHVVRDDTGRVIELLQSRRPTVALLATEFIAALHPMTPGQVERSLETLGFYSVETTLLGEEIVAQTYERLHSREGCLLTIRSTCPVAVDFVRKYHPALVGALAPVVPPYVAQARLIKAMYPPGTAVVYISPCYARKDEAYDEEFGGAVDAAIDFIELKRLIDTAEPRPAVSAVAAHWPERPSLLKEISLTDGFPRQTLASRDMTDTGVRVVRGIAEIDRLLRAMASGDAGPNIIDMLNCESCIDGPAVNPGLSLYAKRSLDAAARRAPGATRVSTRAMLGVLPQVETVRSFQPAPVVLPRPSPAAVDAVLAQGGFTRQTAPDCGACGWPTCEEHALAILRGDSTWEMCFPLQRSVLREAVLEIAESETIDATTGLWNRRVLADRLALELARHDRYGAPLSLVLLDVDDLGRVNDRHGPAAGDAVLAAIGQRISKGIRSTDLAARFRGDEFAVVLPGISKTAAFAVAEKLRQAVRESPVTVTADGYTHDVAVTVTAGIAAVSRPGTDAFDLLEAADAALHEAMAAGKDQVRLAPG
jgi:diguanylate cyclase (GGDEF)-like protein